MFVAALAAEGIGREQIQTMGFQFRALLMARRPMPEILTVRTRTLEIGTRLTAMPAYPVVLLHGFPDDARAFDERRAGPRAGLPLLVLPARLRPTPFSIRTSRDGAASRDRPGLLEFMPRSAWLRPRSPLRLGRRAACIPAILAPERSRARHDRGYNVQNTVSRAAGLGEGRALVLVSVVLQHERASGARAEPARHLPLLWQECRRPGDSSAASSGPPVVRQSDSSRGDHLPPPSRQRSGRWAPGCDRAALASAGDHRAHVILTADDTVDRPSAPRPTPQFRRERAARRTGRRHFMPRGAEASSTPSEASPLDESHMRIEIICTGDEVLTGKIVTPTSAT